MSVDGVTNGLKVMSMCGNELSHWKIQIIQL